MTYLINGLQSTRIGRVFQWPLICEFFSSILWGYYRTIRLTFRMGWGWMFSLVNYGELWREHRRTFTKYFQSRDQSVYQLNHIKFVRGMLSELLDRPHDFMEITRRYRKTFKVIDIVDSICIYE